MLNRTEFSFSLVYIQMDVSESIHLFKRRYRGSDIVTSAVNLLA